MPNPTSKPVLAYAAAGVLWLVLLPIYAYRFVISPLLGVNCRFVPSCSDYAILALKQHGLIRGGWLAASRISRCHPWGGHGYDPCPTPPSKRHNP